MGGYGKQLNVSIHMQAHHLLFVLLNKRFQLYHRYSKHLSLLFRFTETVINKLTM
jgi:hypothetical protein